MKIRSILVFGTAVMAAAVVVVAGAQSQPDRAPFWPLLDTSAATVIDEWYSDLPWHQKLGTYAGNQIDEAIVLPYLALPQADRDFCTSKGMTNQDCMLEVGVNNILGMKRTDRLYDAKTKSTPQQPTVSAAPECQDPTLPCIEVMLTVGNYYYRSQGSTVSLAARQFGSDQPVNGSYAAYNINDGTTYAPQMPWYMSHYCDAMFEKERDFNDPVCYGDYLSTFNSGFNAWGTGGRLGWPTAVPWSPWPQSDTNHCAAGITECKIVLGAFDLKPVPSAFTQDMVYAANNDLLLQWFNNALTHFPADQGTAENQRRFPWSGNTVTWDDFYKPSAQNPFLGTFTFGTPGGQGNVDCYTTLTGPRNKAGQECPEGQTLITRAEKSLYPRQCSLVDLDNGDATRLRKCGLNYEFHHNGWIQQWPAGWDQALTSASIIPANQYGRTSFLFAGVPGMQMPVSFYKNDSVSNLSIYEQVHNSSLFSLYIPIANEADTKRAMSGRQYRGTQFYHTLLMTNHMEADPQVFADGIRGKVLWHNEYRMEGMYRTFLAGQTKFPTEDFNAAVTASAKLPYHGKTCDGCHVRNGSGVPINTVGKLDAKMVDMTTAVYNPSVDHDYTFTSVIRPMKMVFFDLGRSTVRADASVFSEPLSFTPLTLLKPARGEEASLYYTNAIMNYYGDSFHVTSGENNYTWSYEAAAPDTLVVPTARVNPELGKTYTPWQVALSGFTGGVNCQLVTPAPPIAAKAWPTSCDDVSGAKVAEAIQTHKVGHMLLNGKRLGNSSSIEAMPNQAILGFRQSQVALLGDAIAGEVIWTEGTRDGVRGKVQKYCRTNSLQDCFIGRFGWLGDRASLEDQVANAAFVEMNLTSSEGYNQLYPDNKTKSQLRYKAPNCGPANKACVEIKTGNTDLSEADINRMADYARWIGNPTRSEFQVTLPEVVAGERVFRNLQCNACHVINRIDIDPEDTMLSKDYRDRLKKRIAVVQGSSKTIRPFLSYLGTDLLMHDMGYLSQVSGTPAGAQIRDPATGVIKPEYKAFVQKIRTPALKGMRFNRFVTDSYKNTRNPYNSEAPNDPACDFLLHDGRACDAVEAAFLHDGPAIKKLGTIEALTALSPADVKALRAFLYSL